MFFFCLRSCNTIFSYFHSSLELRNSFYVLKRPQGVLFSSIILKAHLKIRTSAFNHPWKYGSKLLQAAQPCWIFCGCYWWLSECGQMAKLLLWQVRWLEQGRESRKVWRCPDLYVCMFRLGSSFPDCYVLCLWNERRWLESNLQNSQTSEHSNACSNFRYTESVT